MISRKTLPRAVDRNRIRRKLREVVRALRPAITHFDIILRIRRAATHAEQDAAVAEAYRLLSALLAVPRP